MLIIGGLLFLFGLVDLIGSWSGFDIWIDWIKVDLPEVVWRFSAWIACNQASRCQFPPSRN